MQIQITLYNQDITVSLNLNALYKNNANFRTTSVEVEDINKVNLNKEGCRKNVGFSSRFLMCVRAGQQRTKWTSCSCDSLQRGQSRSSLLVTVLYRHLWTVKSDISRICCHHTFKMFIHFQC